MQAACAKAGMAFELHVGSTDGDYTENEMVEMGFQAALATQAQHTTSTALIGVNDLVAIGLLAGLRRAGVGVPRLMQAPTWTSFTALSARRAPAAGRRRTRPHKA